MSTNEVRSNDATSNVRADTKLEIVVIPVSDVDRAKEFYAQLGCVLMPPTTTVTTSA